MIEVKDIRIHEDIPNVDGYVLEYRIYDPAKGTRITDDGVEVWNYDKSATFSDNDLDNAVVRLEEILTERLSA